MFFCFLFYPAIGLHRSSCWQMFFKTRVLKNFSVFTGKHLCWRLILIKLQALNACNFIKKRLTYRCFRVDVLKLLRTATLKNICQQLLLYRPIAEKNKDRNKINLMFNYVLEYCISKKFIRYILYTGNCCFYL